MKEVLVPKTNSTELREQLLALYGALKGSKEKDQIYFNFQEVRWACPLLILPLSVHIQTNDGSFTMEAAHYCKKYFDAIRFPKGVDSLSDFGQQIQRHKSYIPISVLKREPNEEREKLESQFSEMIVRSIGDLPGLKDSIYYPISELVTNIFDHSKDQKGYVFGQWYPTKNFLDICIVDTGRGLKTAYKEEKQLELTDAQAIQEALRGNSTKKEKERGFGLRTSIKVICKGLGGSFVIISGNAALVAQKHEEQPVRLPDFSWKGVIIAYRIPRPTEPFVISNYIE